MKHEYQRIGKVVATDQKEGQLHVTKQGDCSGISPERRALAGRQAASEGLSSEHLLNVRFWVSNLNSSSGSFFVYKMRCIIQEVSHPRIISSRIKGF